VPAPLPPHPPVLLEGDLARLYENAIHALGKLDGTSARLDLDRLLYMYVRKEAVLTSQIEGTQSTLSELLEYENADAPGTPVDDVREVSRYVDALTYAIGEIQTGRLPLCVRLLRNAHSRLMADAAATRPRARSAGLRTGWVGRGPVTLRTSRLRPTKWVQRSEISSGI
jgi:Fic family protein